MPAICYTQLSAEERKTMSLRLAHGDSLRRALSLGGFFSDLGVQPLTTDWQVAPPQPLERLLNHS